MALAAVFFDRDNTLIVSDGYLGDASKVVLMEGAAAAVAAARRMGYATVTISNQSGVARGLFTEEAVHAVNRRIDELLRQADPAALIDRHEFCPYHPEAPLEQYRRDSDRRKPQPGMLYSAAEALGLDLSRSWVIGDAPRDIEAGKRAGCRTILLKDPKLPVSPAAEESGPAPDFTVASLADAISIIQQLQETPTPASREEQAMSQQERPAGAASAELPEPPAVTPAAASPRRLEELAEQILAEIRRQREQPASEFSMSKLLAGVVQVIVLAVLFYAYLRPDTASTQAYLLWALVFQAMTIALLIMGQQR